MLELIILIIKIVVLAILVIILSIVAFCIVPIKYDLKSKVKDKVLSIEFKYLLFFFDFYVDFNDIRSLKYKAYILGKCIADSRKKTIEAKEADKSVASSIKDTEFIQNKEVEKEVNVDRKVFKDLLKRSEEYDKKLNEAKTEKEKNKIIYEEVTSRISDFFDIFKSSLPKDMLDAAKIISAEAVKYHKNIMPKTFILDLTLGLDDPYTVGRILSFFAILYGKYGDSIVIRPYFDRDILYGELHIIGYPQLINMLLPIAHIFTNKRFRQILFNLKERKKGKGAEARLNAKWLLVK